MVPPINSNSSMSLKMMLVTGSTEAEPVYLSCKMKVFGLVVCPPAGLYG